MSDHAPHPVIGEPFLDERGYELAPTVYVVYQKNRYYRWDDAGPDTVCTRCGHVVPLGDAYFAMDWWEFGHFHEALCDVCGREVGTFPHPVETMIRSFPDEEES